MRLYGKHLDELFPKAKYFRLFVCVPQHSSQEVCYLLSVPRHLTYTNNRFWRRASIGAQWHSSPFFANRYISDRRASPTEEIPDVNHRVFHSIPMIGHRIESLG